ncbi:unnamed protein product [Closterium sp. NIES-53]
MYLMMCIRPDLAYPLSILVRYVAPERHQPEHWKAANRVLRYLCRTSGMALVRGGRGPVVLTGHADASWVDDLATQRSSQGYPFSIGSGSFSWRCDHTGGLGEYLSGRYWCREGGRHRTRADTVLSPAPEPATAADAMVAAAATAATIIESCAKQPLQHLQLVDQQVPDELKRHRNQLQQGSH